MAVRVTAWLDVTDSTLVLKTALPAPAGMTIDAGTVAAALLLDRITDWPPVGAVALKLTVHDDAEGPTRELLAQESELTTAIPAPLRVTTFVALPYAELDMVRVPVAAPAMTGVKRTGSDVDWPGFSVIGNVTPEIEKPLPETVAALIVRALVPVEVRISDCVAVAFTTALPKAILLALRLIAAVAVGFAVIIRELDTPPEVPVIVAVCAV